MFLLQVLIVRHWWLYVEYERGTRLQNHSSFIFTWSISLLFCWKLLWFRCIYKFFWGFRLYTRNIKIFDLEQPGHTVLRNNVFDSRSNFIQSGVLLVRCTRRSVSMFLVPLSSYFSIFIYTHIYTRVTKIRNIRIFRIRDCKAFRCNGIRLKTSKFKWKHRSSF